MKNNKLHIQMHSHTYIILKSVSNINAYIYIHIYINRLRGHCVNGV